MEATESQRIRSLRPPKPVLDPWRPVDVLLEHERQPDGGLAQVLTVFITGRECPFTCVFCDLWRFTTDTATPEGAIPTQIDEAISRFEPELEDSAQIKLYNASNYFETGAVPPRDDPEVLRRINRFAKVIVECHPRLVAQQRCQNFATALGDRLQVAMGLETIHPQALPKLNKRSTLDDFCSAGRWLKEHGVGLRAFVLLGAPFIASDETVDWAVRSASFAFEQGAEQVALVPVRGGNGEMERLRESGLFHPPSMPQIEDAIERCVELDAGVVTVDTWDLELFADCSACTGKRAARLQRINLRGRLELPIDCSQCGSGPSR